ncbi:hypothetical protein HAX54_008094, partial [Datura stramonium]|nr:hypothetical protein [Datura stramonium]
MSDQLMTDLGPLKIGKRQCLDQAHINDSDINTIVEESREDLGDDQEKGTTSSQKFRIALKRMDSPPGEVLLSILPQTWIPDPTNHSINLFTHNDDTRDTNNNILRHLDRLITKEDNESLEAISTKNEDRNAILFMDPNSYAWPD